MNLLDSRYIHDLLGLVRKGKITIAHTSQLLKNKKNPNP